MFFNSKNNTRCVAYGRILIMGKKKRATLNRFKAARSMCIIRNGWRIVLLVLLVDQRNGEVSLLASGEHALDEEYRILRG